MSPPTLPLTPLTFQQALRTGHGRALQHVLAHGTGELDGILIEACLKCPLYAPQGEPSRAPWLARMLEIGRLTQRALAAIQADLDEGEPDADYCDRLQRRELLLEFALKGVRGGRDLLYTSLARNPDSTRTSMLELPLHLLTRDLQFASAARRLPRC